MGSAAATWTTPSCHRVGTAIVFIESESEYGTPARRPITPKPHVLARQRLLELLRRLHRSGEKRLPGERALCQEIDIAPVTLRKVLKQLAAEGCIRCVPRSGNFLGEVPEYRNLGVVIGDGSTVSFLHGAPAISGIIDTCAESCVHLRTVQLREPGRIGRVLSDYGLDGCIWNAAEPAQLDTIAQAARDADIPVVVLIVHAYDPATVRTLPGCFVAPDLHGIGALRARFMLGRGHRAIACFTDRTTVVYAGFTSAIAAAHATHRPEWAFRADEIATHLPRILDQGEATALIVNGGSRQMAEVLRIVDEHPAGGRIELLLDHVGAPMAGILAQHPRLRVAAINRYPDRELGATAASLLLDHLQNGRPLAPLRLLSRLTAADGTPIDHETPATKDPT